MNSNSVRGTPLRSVAPGFVALIVILFGNQVTLAGSATWKASPATGDWNTASNWSPATVPNSATDTATFATSNKTSVSISADTTVDSILFNAGASAFTITAPSETQLLISGAGITNQSGAVQNFVAAKDVGQMFFGGSASAGDNVALTVEASDTSGVAAGEADFFETSSAGDGVFLVQGGAANNAVGGRIELFGSSSAASSTITINGGAVSGAFGGQLAFSEKSTAANATLIAMGGAAGAEGGQIDFGSKSHGGKARVELFGNGTLGIGSLKGTVPQLSVGSIEGDGVVILSPFGSGVSNNLIVGTNNLDTTFSGVIEDNGYGGSLTKVGHGKFTLSGANTYTGGTTLNKGTLIAKNKTGSATGTGAVQVNSGTLSGTGKISGTVTVGNGTTAGAILQPGIGSKPGTLTINSTVSFNATSAFKWNINRVSPPVGATPLSGAKPLRRRVCSGSFAEMTFPLRS